ncbi:SLAM family member 9-like, partial [Aquarana catesbeiana]|uniref:SLAM family member 9-like n=1 Tax=Aquarana catesbeiana TaxID=8400 RepID=UPI003CC9EFFB
TSNSFVFTGEEVVPIRVNCLLNQSILLSPSVDSSHSVQHVYWNFQTYIMASYINNQLTVIQDKFEGRLEIVDNGRSLRIGELRLEDSGMYAGTITFTDKSKDQKTYNLTVYDYVPVPTIEGAEMKKDGEWCNVTLHCSTSTNTSALSYIWNYKHGNSSSTILHNKTGDTIKMSLQPESWDMEIMCIVQNPVDRKNVSVQKICRDYDGNKTAAGRRPFRTIRGRNHYVLSLVVLVVLGAVWYLVKIKKKQRKDLTRTNPEDITYTEVRLTRQNESKQVPKEARNPPEGSSEDIVYSTLRHVTD